MATAHDGQPITMYREGGAWEGETDNLTPCWVVGRTATHYYVRLGWYCGYSESGRHLARYAGGREGLIAKAKVTRRR